MENNRTPRLFDYTSSGDANETAFDILAELKADAQISPEPRRSTSARSQSGGKRVLNAGDKKRKWPFGKRKTQEKEQTLESNDAEIATESEEEDEPQLLEELANQYADDPEVVEEAQENQDGGEDYLQEPEIPEEELKPAPPPIRRDIPKKERKHIAREQQKKDAIKQIKVPPVPLLVLSLIYLELVQLIGNGFGVQPKTLLLIVLFDGAFALIVYVLSSLTKFPKLNATIMCLLLGITSLFIGVQYFCKSVYNNYMGIKAIAVGAKGVVNSFLGTMFKLIFLKFYVVILLLIPLVITIVLLKKGHLVLKRERKEGSIFVLVLALVLTIIGVIAVNIDPVNRLLYKKNYNYDTAVPAFGVVTGTRLDLKYLIFGNKASSSFTIEESSEEEAPSEETASTQEGEEQVASETKPPVVYGKNVMNIDFAARAENEDAGTVFADVDSFVASRKASSQNEYTGMFKGKNLILITAEAFSNEALDPKLTPTLWRMANKGIQIENYYQPAWGGSTSTGEFSNVMGIIPVSGVSSMIQTAYLNNYFTMGNQLQRLNYYSMAFHNHDYDYYDRDLTHENLGYSTYMGYGNGLEDMIDYVWPESDKQLIDATIPMYIDKQPFSIYYMTVSGHAYYDLGGNFQSAKYYDSIAEKKSGSEEVLGYYACTQDLEAAMATLLKTLEDKGIADDTVIVLAADHYPYGLEGRTSTAGYKDALAELYGYVYDTPWERDHNRLIIWSGCLEDQEPIVVTDPVYSLDIAPTLSNLFGTEFDSRLYVGRDILSDAEPLVLWVDRSWMTDKAAYDSIAGDLTVFEGYENVVDDDYVSRINNTLYNYFSYSNTVLDYDYFGHLFGEDVNT